MRGIVTLLLALGLDDKKFTSRPLFLNTTYVVIFFTNIVIGILTRPLVANLGVRSEVEGVNTLDPAATLSRVPTEGVVKQERSAFARWWYIVDNKYLKKLFGGRKRPLDDVNKSAVTSTDNQGKIEEIGGGGESSAGASVPSSAVSPPPQSLNAAGPAAVAIMSESDVSDAEKIVGSTIGMTSSSSSSSSSSGNAGGSEKTNVGVIVENGDDVDDDDDDDVIAPMSDSIRFIEITDNDEAPAHHHHRHHHHHHHGSRHGSSSSSGGQGRSLLIGGGNGKSYGSVSNMSRSMVVTTGSNSGGGVFGEGDMHDDDVTAAAASAGSASLVIMDDMSGIGGGRNDEKMSLLKK